MSGNPRTRRPAASGCDFKVETFETILAWDPCMGSMPQSAYALLLHLLHPGAPAVPVCLGSFHWLKLGRRQYQDGRADTLSGHELHLALALHEPQSSAPTPSETRHRTPGCRPVDLPVSA